MNLVNNTVLITGGATGIGFELAKVLLAKGNTVLVCARTQTNLDNAKTQLPGLVTYRCDIGDGEQRRAMQEKISADGYAINVLVNNAAIMSNYDLANSDTQSITNIRREIGVNFVAPIELIHELLPVLKLQSSAVIININSPQGVVPGARTPLLSATKAGLYSYSRSLRLHLAEDRIKVINVFPPGVETPKTAHLEFKKISASQFVDQLILNLKRNKNEIWIGESKALRVISHISQRLAFSLLNKRLPIVRAMT